MARAGTGRFTGLILIAALLSAVAWADEPGDAGDVEVAPAAGAMQRDVPADRKKWGPHVDVGARWDTDRVLGLGDFFVPLWQDEDSLAFADLRVSGDNSDNVEGNFGAAYRQMLDAGWILGGYGFFDVRSSDQTGSRNTFLGGTLGVEALSETFDVRANGYIPDDDPKSAPSASRGSFSGGTVVVERGVERALYGFDGELGVRLPFGEDSPFWDTRVYAGGYYFDASGASSLGGGRGRFESRIYDIPLIGDYLGEGARLTLSAEVTYDDRRHAQALGGVSLRIPFYGWFGGGHGSAPGGGLSRLERRMTDPIVRDVEIVVSAGTRGRERALNARTEVPIQVAAFADAVGGGNGSRKDPWDLATALSNAGANGVVVIRGNQGPIVGSGYTVLDGQTVVGGGGSFLVRGERSGQLVFVRAPGRRPIIDNPDAVATFLVNDALFTEIASVEVLRGPQGMLFNNSANALVRDVGFSRQSGYGIQANFSSDFTGKDLRFDDITGTQAVGGAFFFSNGVKLDGVRARNLGGLGTNYAAALSFFQSSNQQLSDVDVQGLFSDNTAVGLDFFDGSGADLSGIDVREVYADFAVGSNFVLYNDLFIRDAVFGDISGDIDGVGLRYFSVLNSEVDGLRADDIRSSGGQASGIDATDVVQAYFTDAVASNIIGSTSAAGFRLQEGTNVDIEDFRVLGVDVQLGDAWGLRASLSQGFRAQDFDIQDVSGDNATGVDLSDVDNAQVLYGRIGNVFGMSSGSGIRFNGGMNAWAMGFEVDGVEGDVATGFGFNSADAAYMGGVDVRNIQGASRGTGGEVYFSPNFQGFQVGIESVGGDNAGGVDVFDSNDGSFGGLEIGGVLGNDFAFGGRLSLSADFRYTDLEVNDVRAGNDVRGFDVSDSPGFDAERYRFVGLEGNFAHGWRISGSPAVRLTDGYTARVRGGMESVGLYLDDSSGFFGQGLRFDRIEGDFAIGARFQLSLGAQLVDVDVQRVRGENEGWGFIVQGSAGWNGERVDASNVTGDDAYGIWFQDSDDSSLRSSSFSRLGGMARVRGVWVEDSDGWEGEDLSVDRLSGDRVRGFKFAESFGLMLVDSEATRIEGQSSAQGVRVRNSDQVQIERMFVNKVFAQEASGFRVEDSDAFSLYESYVRKVNGYVMDVSDATNLGGDDNRADAYDDFCNDRGGNSGQTRFVAIGFCIDF